MLFRILRTIRKKLRNSSSNRGWYKFLVGFKNLYFNPFCALLQELYRKLFYSFGIKYINGRDAVFPMFAEERILLRVGIRGPLFIGKKIVFSGYRLRSRGQLDRQGYKIRQNCHLDNGQPTLVSSFLEAAMYEDGKLEVTNFKRPMLLRANFLINPNKENLVHVPKISGFFHFYIQLVPLLLRLKEDYQISIDLDTTNEYFEILQYFGIKLSEVGSPKKSNSFGVARTIKQRGLYPSIEDVRLLNSFHRDISVETTPTRNLYLTRFGNTNGRHITNESELLESLNRFGFETVDPGKMSFAAQSKLFYEAKNIVAPHGSALSHLVAVPSSCNIIELNSPSNVRWHFRKMSEALDLRHTLIIGKESTGSDFSIDPNFLVEGMFLN